MNELAHEIVVTPRWRLGVWAARAWRRLSWRHVPLALVITFARDSIHPLGGIFFPPTEVPGWDPVGHLLTGSWVLNGLSIVYGVLVADEAFDDGVPPLRAYGSLLVALVVFGPALDRLFFVLLSLTGQVPSFAGEDEGAVQLVWWSLVLFYECGFGLSIYAYWRITQRAMRQAQAAETERVRNEQRLHTARLLALQSRVEPQVLFDTLGRVDALHHDEPEAADALLADLIALLRSLQPCAVADNSTVEREFALVEAWLRVNRSTGREAARIHLHLAPDARPVSVAPMLVLPLLRAVLALPRATEGEWLLSARTAGQRLLVTLQLTADGDADAHGELARADLSSLHDRLARLFGRTATLAVSPRPPSVKLDLPRLQEEDSDDDRTDR
jgi:hypothetical protein